MSDIPKIIPWFEMAFKNIKGGGVVLEPGKAYLIVCKDRLAEYDVPELQEYLTNIEKDYNCKFLILHGMQSEPTIYDITAILAGNYSAVLEEEGVQVLEVSRKFRLEKAE